MRFGGRWFEGIERIPGLGGDGYQRRMAHRPPQVGLQLEEPLVRFTQRQDRLKRPIDVNGRGVQGLAHRFQLVEQPGSFGFVLQRRPTQAGFQRSCVRVKTLQQCRVASPPDEHLSHVIHRLAHRRLVE